MICEIKNLIVPPVFKGEKEGIGLTIPSLQLAPGHVYALVGPSGAGKSVLQSLLTGFPAFSFSPSITHSAFSLFGVEISQEAFAHRKIFHRSTRHAFSSGTVLYLPQTLPTDKSFALRTKGLMGDIVHAAQTALGIQQPVQAALHKRFEEMNIRPLLKKKLTTLSGGERRRAELLTRLLPLKHVKNPVLVILDEPTTGFDTGSELTFLTEIRRMAAELKEAGAPVAFLISTHAMRHLRDDIFDEVIVVNRDKRETPTGEHLNCCVIYQGGITEAPARLGEPFLKEMPDFSWSDFFSCLERTTCQDLLVHYTRKEVEQ